MLLGLEPTYFGFLRPRESRRRVREALAVLEHPEIQPDSPVQRLSPAAQQLVEIARAAARRSSRSRVLDEPTSSLTQEDARRLFALVARLRNRGVSVVYISHYLEEVQQVADRFLTVHAATARAWAAVRFATFPWRRSLNLWSAAA